MNYYEDFVTFRDNYELDTDPEIIKAKQNNLFIEQNYGKLYLLEKYFASKYCTGEDNYKQNYYNIEFNLLRDFPSDFIIELLETNLNSRQICYYDLVNIEIVKYVYFIWNMYDDLPPNTIINYPANRYALIIKQIKHHLIITAHTKPQAYYDMLYNPKNPKYNRDKNYIYGTWWLYAFYPLLPTGEQLIMKLIDFVYLDDAQDMLLYGIYQMPVEKLNPFFKKFLLELKKQEQDHCQKRRTLRPCFDINSSATGALSEIIDILKKLYQNGHDLVIDRELKSVFQTRDNKNMIRYLVTDEHRK